MLNEDEMMIHRRRIIIWIITVAIIVATLFGVGKFISYRTMVLLLPDLMGRNVLGVWLALPLNDVNHPCGCGCLAYA